MVDNSVQRALALNLREQNKHKKFILVLNAEVKVHVSCGEGRSKL